jgi:osmotically-inducible protein OsmY
MLEILKKLKSSKLLFMNLAAVLFAVGLMSFNGPMGEKGIDDKDITMAVESELLVNQATPSYLIDVKTTEGIVTLTGEVDNILASKRAAKIARSVKGVKSVINRIDVEAPLKADYILRQDIVDALLYDPATEAYDVEVSVNDGHVTLKGVVESWQEKQLAEYVASGVTGVESVQNDINFKITPNRSDYEIMNDVKAALSNNIIIDDGLIDVEVNEGEVILSGVVGSSAERVQARSYAWVSGVSNVDDSKLMVESWARDDKMRENKYVEKSDDEIERNIVDAYFYDPRVYSFNPEVEVENGIVTLTGVVSNLKAKEAAEQVAKNTVGVFSVRNYLKVRPADVPANQELENRIQNSWQRDPAVDADELTISVFNGVASVRGTVDTYFEKHQAEDAVLRTKGVVAVDNNIVVRNNYEAYQWGYTGWNNLYPPYYYTIDADEDSKTDWEIMKDIEEQIWWSPYVNLDDVDITVDDHVATLTGVVDTRREKLFAEINAIEGGAADVVNKLRVEYAPEN